MVMQAKEADALETVVKPIYGHNFLFGRRAGSRLSLPNAAHRMLIRLVCPLRQIMLLQTPSMSEAHTWCCAKSLGVPKAQLQNVNVGKKMRRKCS